LSPVSDYTSRTRSELETGEQDGKSGALSHTDRPRGAVDLIGRVVLSIIFIQTGWSKIFGYAGTVEHMNAAGVPGALLPLVILTELGGGLLILLGLFTRYAAIALAGFCVLAAYLFHYQPGDMMQMINFMKNITIAGGFLVLAGAGPGALALDNLRR
jgi:putative oxidoreductase